MPQVPSNGPPPERSEERLKTLRSGGSSGIFTAGFPDQTARNGDPNPSGHEDRPSPDLLAGAVEPFPEGFVRMPIPDALIEAMAGLSDSALRSLLGLIRLSFRFDPETSTWVCPDRTFSRAEIQAECGLSGQGTREGLSELESGGYVSIDRSGRSHEHVLLVGVPSSRFTYVPTGLFEEAPELSGTELRFVMAVLRATWGWTTNADGAEAPEHKRWARLTTPNLSQLTGRSESAVKQAARELQGTWLQRRRPQGGAFYYRFRTEVITSERLTSGRPATQEDPNEGDPREGKPTLKKKADVFFSMGIPNDLPPDRQQSGPPLRENIERSLEISAQHTASTERKRSRRNRPPSRSEGSAVPGGENPSRGSAGPPAPRSRPEEPRPEEPRPEEARPGRGSGRSSRDPGPDSAEELDLTGVSGRKRRLGQKLANAGVWPRRIPELLARYSAERIEANFQLYRKRAQQVRKSGAWLATAIEEGYALPVQVGERQPGERQPGERPPSRHSPSGHPVGADPAGADPAGADSTGKAPAESGGSRYRAGGPKAKSGPKAGSRPAGGGEGRAPGLPAPGTKVSESRKRRLVRAGVAAEADFEKFADYDDPDRKQHFYRVEKTPSRARPSPAARA